MILGEFNQLGASTQNGTKQSADKIDKSLAANPLCSVCPSLTIPARKETRRKRETIETNQKRISGFPPAARLCSKME